MSASISNVQNPPIATSTPAASANSKISPSIASSAAPVVVGQHGKSSSISPVNGTNTIKPAVPAMGPAIVNSSGANGDHSRKSSVTITAAGTSGSIPNGGPVVNSRAPSNLTFGSLAGSPAPSHVAPHHPQNLNPQAHNPRINSPTHSPSPIPTPIASGGKPDTLPTRPNLVFGGDSDSTEPNNRPMSMPPQPHQQPQAHFRQGSNQSTHSETNRGFQSGNSGRGRGGFQPGYPQIGHPSPQPQYRTINPPRGPMPTNFQPAMHPNSPYRQTRSPAITPAVMHQQQMATQPGMPFYPGQQYPQMNYMPQQMGNDPYGQYYGQSYPQPYGGMGQSMYAPSGIPPSPRGHYQMPYGGAPPQAQGMARSNSNMSESRPQSAVAQPSTPAMTNVNASHTHTPSVASASPAPSSSNFAIPSKTKSKAIIIKTSDGKVVDFKSDKKPTSPAPPAVAQPKSPAIVATPTPPPRPESTHSRAESVAAKTDSDRRADFVLQFKKQLEAEAAQKEAEEKKAKEEEAAAIAQKEKEEQAAKEEAEKAAKEKADAEAAKKAAEDEAEKKRLEEEEFERMVLEMERIAIEEEAKENAFREQKKIEDAKLKAQEAKEADERLKAAEREAEEREAKREAMRAQGGDDEAAKLFAGLKKNTQFGPGAGQESGASTPVAETVSTPPAQLKSATPKAKPQPLKLETTKAVEPAQPTAGMTSLKSARFLAIKNEVNYPEGVRSPNPALNQGGKGGKGRPYDMSFLLQFQNVFKEKPSVDWDRTLKETVGDTDSARPQSARTPAMGGRQPSRGGGLGAMGSFQGGFPSVGRTLPPGTTSEERFRQASSRGGTMPNPLAQFGPGRTGGAGAFPVQMTRTSSFQNMGAQNGPNSPRVGSSRGRGSRRGGDKPSHNAKEEKAMPLTAGMQIKDLERSSTGWQPMSRTQMAAAQAAAGHMAPDMVQRKVKAALNKMTPEKFDKIADQILEIAGQSKNEQDGRTLRQVIQLTFEKACDEQHWSSMYAKFCAHMLNTMSTDIKDENVRDKHGQPVVGGALFRKYLLNRCQEEFEKGWEINLPDKPEGQSGEAALLSEDYYLASAAKRRGLGLIQFIGELYKLNMLTLRIMHECVLKLLDFEGLPDESAVESLTKLLRTVGGTMYTADAGPKMLDVYFQRVEKIMNMDGLNSRLKFMLMDLCDLRRSNWVSKDAGKGPMTLQEIHQQAAAAQQQAELERARTNTRGGPRAHMGRGDARSFSGSGMPPPQDYPTGRVQMDDLRKLSKGASGRNTGGALGPSMLGSRSGSGRRGLGPGGALMGRGEESGASSRTGTPPVQKEKEPTNANSFSALMSLDNEGAGEVGSPPSTAGSPPQSKAALARSKSPAVEGKSTV